MPDQRKTCNKCGDFCHHQKRYCPGPQRDEFGQFAVSGNCPHGSKVEHLVVRCSMCHYSHNESVSVRG